MYLRDTDFSTLESVADQLRDRRQTWGGSSTSLSVLVHDGTETQGDQGARQDLDEEEAEYARETQRIGTLRFGDHEVPFNNTGMATLAKFYEIPYKFLERVSPEEQQFILTSRIQRTEDRPLTLKYSPDTGVNEAYLATQRRISPSDIADRLMEQGVMEHDAQVVEWFSTPDEFRLDVIVPADFDSGIGGDRQVGDLTYGGLRIGQNRKQNLAPWVQPFMFRLVCTNGMEVPDYGLKVEARGAEAEDVIMMLMSESSRAMKRIEDDIKHFYDLRTVKVDEDTTGLFRRMTREIGLPDRTIGRMENTLADALLAEDEVTMFHLVNHLTNQANDPMIRHSYNARRAMERGGGQMISDHAARCDRCHSRLN